MLSGSKLGESNDSIEYFINPIDYKNKLLEAKKAFCLIDLKLESHNGLSFRFYESLYFQKKLITNNKDVVNYDFYNSNNILIVDYDNLIKDDINSAGTKSYTFDFPYSAGTYFIDFHTNTGRQSYKIIKK